MNASFFNGKKILVTGAGSGLGRELTLRLCREGAEVLALSKSEEKLKTLRHETEQNGSPACEILPCDVTNRDQVVGCLRNKPVEIVILNAGIKATGSEPFSAEKIRATFEVNLFGVVNCIEALLPGMIGRGSGHLVFISSLGGHHGITEAHGYNASKAALSNLVDSLRMDFKRSSLPITVTAVKPGPFDTAMIDQGGLVRLFSITKERAAEKILKGIAREKIHFAFPVPFYLLTLLVAALPKRIQGFLLSRAKGSPSPQQASPCQTSTSQVPTDRAPAGSGR